MAWTAEKVKAMRESNPAKATESDGWTAEKVRAMRTKTPTATTPKAGVATVETTPKQEKTPLYADALDSYRTGGAMARQSPAAKWGGVPSIAPLTGKNVLEDTTSGAKAYGTSLAQKQKQYNDQHSQTDEFDAINQWLDTGDNKNLADAVRRVDNTNGAYTDKDLITKGGWTQEQIDTARQMNAALDAIPAWKRGVRRTWPEPWAQTMPRTRWPGRSRTGCGGLPGTGPWPRITRRWPMLFPAAWTTPCRPLWKPMQTRLLMLHWATRKPPRRCSAKRRS